MKHETEHLWRPTIATLFASVVFVVAEADAYRPLINGETIRGGKPENFALAGFIWELPNGMILDLAGRTGLTRAAFDWEVRGGITVSFSLFPQRQVSKP